MKGRPGPARQDPTILPEMYTARLSPSLPQRDPWLLPRMTVHCTEGISMSFEDTGSEQTLSLTDPSVTSQGYVIYGVLAQVCPKGGPVGPQTHPVAISTVPECTE